MWALGLVPWLLEGGLAQVLVPLSLGEGLDQESVPGCWEQGLDQEMVLVWVSLLWEVVLDLAWGAEWLG